MTTKTSTEMNLCDKCSTITAETQDDGTIKIIIDSNCEKIKKYAERIGCISMEDAMTFENSKVIDPDVREGICTPCLTPNAIFYASWMEMGMISKKLAQRVGENAVKFEKE